MKWSFASVGVIMAGLTGIVILLLFQQITTNNESDYYLLKEVTEAAMTDAIDISYYRETGRLKMVKEKFIENFTRRFAESTNLTGTGYTVNFYDIMEDPPKASIIINTGLGQYTIYGDSSEYNISNKLDAILEITGKYTNIGLAGSEIHNPPYTTHCSSGCDKNSYEKIYYSMPYSNSSYFEIDEPINIPEELNKPNINNIKIESIQKAGVVTTEDELLLAKINREIDWTRATDDGNLTDYSLSISSFAKSITINDENLDFINCKVNKEGNSYCDSNNYVIKWNGNSTEGKNNIAVKLKIAWSYNEYEYAD